MKVVRRDLALAAMILIVIWAVFLAGGCMETTVSPVETANGEEAPDLQGELQGKIQEVRSNAADLAATIHGLINEERRNNGLNPLQWDPTLANIALSHSKDMAVRDYFDHVSPEGDDFADRYEESGYRLETSIGNQVYVGGENLFLNNVVRSYAYDQETNDIFEYQYNDPDELARSTVQGWMDSPGHRDNILTPFTREGIGIYVTDEGEVYITENFS
jgi:uncharacterized protein YkwD